MSELSAQIANLSAQELALFAKRLKEKHTHVSSKQIIPQRSKSNSSALSFAQKRLWFLDQLQPNSDLYNVSGAVSLTGQLNIVALEQSFQEIVRRHEALRTTFTIQEDGQPIQKIATSLHLSLPLVDLRELPEQERLFEVQKLANQEAKRFFCLNSGPLLRTTLLQLSEVEHVLLITMHHIVSDAWSIGVLIQELAALYEVFTEGRLSPLPELPIQYADFAVWQRQWLQGEVLETQLSYWKKQLAGIPPMLELPTDRPRSTVQSFRGATQFFELSPNLSEALKGLSQRSGVTLFMTLLAAFQTLLYRYTGTEDICIGTPIANRNRSETEQLIGLFVNTLVLRTDISGNPSFQELLDRVREITLGAYAHQELPFEQLVETLQPERSLSHQPLFQVVFSLQNTPMDAFKLPELTIKPLEIENTTAKLDLTLEMEESKQGLVGSLEYNIDLFDVTTITRMLSHFQTILEAIVKDPLQRLADLPLLTSAEWHQLLIKWNNTEVKYPFDKCIHQLFEAQVENTPDAVAVVFKDQQVTYRELNDRANQLAHYLKSLGVGPEVPVAICVERSVEMVVGLLSIFKASGVYVPLNPAYPFELLSFMLEDVQPPVLLTQEMLLEELPSYWTQVVCLDSDWEAIATESQENSICEATAKNLAYIIYTSGSTGKPKGVQIAHQGLCNLVQFQIRTFNIESKSRILQFASSSFDASVWEMIMALCSGATLCLAMQNDLLPSPALIQLLQEQSITHVTFPPSALAVLPAAELPVLQNIIVAGETCGSDLVAQWSGNRRFFNAYGPTESTICATIAECTSNSNKPSIGHPIANHQVYILDKNLQPVPIGVAGELYIGGVGVARGYLNCPELTTEKFITNPFSQDKEARLYKTGDRVRYLPNGNIEFLSRLDQQVKVRGYRIELGEIEAKLTQNPSVRSAVVIPIENNSGDKRLVAYVVPEHLQNDRETSEVDYVDEENNHPKNLTQYLKGYLKELLPHYMVPSDFMLLESLPLTPNGKVDRRALPALFQAQPKITSNFVAPRDTVELKLAEIWEEVLDVHPLGVKDNFFDLGGHSLLAIRLMSKVQQQFEKDLPLTTLFSGPTIEQLASFIRERSDTLPWSPLVAIQQSGSKRPFFFMPGGGGTVIYLYHLARYLGTDQPFYGLQARGLDGESLPHTRVDELATYNIQALRAIQPQGPYLLGGHSFGSFVAFEMAMQLHLSGEKVALLALMDTPAGITDNHNSSELLDDTAYLVSLAKNVERFTGKNLSISYEDLQQLDKEEQLNYVLEWLKMVNIFPAEAKLKQLRGYLQVSKANDQTVYQPQSIYPERITVFKATENKDFGDDIFMGWDKFSSLPVETHLISAHHISMMTEPNVQTLAKKLKSCIDKAQAID